MNRILKSLLLVFTVAICFCHYAIGQSKIEYDIVLMGGRVIDPETKLDAIKNVGIIHNRIAQISSEPLRGKQTINVSGLVVAPGFIDMHVHGRTNIEQEYQLHDGLTTSLDLEYGIENLKEWYATRHSKALINFGASVCWPYERFKAFDKNKESVSELLETSIKGESSIDKLTDAIRSSFLDQETAEELNKTMDNIKSSLSEGGIGIGVPIGYLPKTNPLEIYRVFQLAGEMNVLVFTHVRNPDIISIQEVIADAALTNASLHIAHINSMALGNIQFGLDLVNTARKRGIDVTAEIYPYTAASTNLESAIFSDGWQDRLGISYADLQWVGTGERLTKETFDAYRKTGGTVIIYMMKPEWIKTGIAGTGVIIASDGMVYSKLAHPRTGGTFSRVLGKYVREENVIDLTTAIGKMTFLPAKRLENTVPMMRFKGRIQMGADADITIFNSNKIIDKGTFENGPAFSEGIEFVLVNGVFVLRNGKTVENVFPGQPIYGKYKK